MLDKPTPELSFAQLLAPLDPADFFRDHWQRKTLWSPTSEKVRELVSLADIDYLLGSLTTPGRSWMQLVKAGASLGESAYCTGESFVSLPKVYAAYQAGYTIQLAKMHKRWPAVGLLCREVEASFTAAGVPLAHRIGSHLYLTPPGSVGLDPHYDSHDVIVVQVEGVKRWKVYGALEEFPIAMQQGMIPRDELPSLEHDIQLQAGQILYIPRGIYHEAMTEGTYSVHVTLDIFPYTWMDLASRIMTGLPRFREALPVGSWTDKGAAPALARELRKRVTELVGSADLDSLARAMLEEFLGNLDTLPDDGFTQLHELDSVDLDTIVARRSGALPRMIGNGGGIQLRFPGSGFRGPEGLVPVFRFLLESDRFAVRDLPDLLDGDSKLEIARELIREGMLKIVGPTS